jgi:hypothetical protein
MALTIGFPPTTVVSLAAAMLAIPAVDVRDSGVLRHVPRLWRSNREPRPCPQLFRRAP